MLYLNIQITIMMNALKFLKIYFVKLNFVKESYFLLLKTNKKF
jgi:hypothetical protein